MKIRFAVAIEGKNYEVSGSYLLNDEEIFDTLKDQAIFPVNEENVQFFEMDTETGEVDKSIFYKMEDD
jgi:hypothetical protein